LQTAGPESLPQFGKDGGGHKFYAPVQLEWRFFALFSFNKIVSEKHVV
jgi:hypothetical protein